MAKAWIRQYGQTGSAPSQDPAVDKNIQPSNMQIGQEPGTDLTPVTFTTTTQSEAIADGMEFVAITADAAFHYVVGSNPVASVNALRVPADAILFIGVKPGQKIAFVAAA